MKFEEYRKFDAIGLAELIRKKEVSAAELLEIAMNRAEQVNGKINAIVTPLYELAKSNTENIDIESPFCGVPYLIKDLLPQLKGTRYTCGSRLLKGFISKENSYVTDKIISSGLNIFGKTNTPEFGLTPFTEPELFGPARNPWNTDYTTGGSSGGSAAAVAAGIVPMASANDGGGSIRIPASCNGLFSLKPSRGTVSLGPHYGEMWNGAVCEGVISRSVRDSALYYDCIMGNASGDPYLSPLPPKGLYKGIQNPVRKLKIGYSFQFPKGFDFPIDEENKKSILHTVELLQKLGHTVEEVELPFDKTVNTEMLYMLALSDCSATIEHICKEANKKPSHHDVEPNTWLLYKLGKSFSAQEFLLSKYKWNDLSRKMQDFHQKYDVLLTPTLGTKPFKIGALQSSKVEDFALRTLNALGLSTLIRYSGLIEKISSKIFQFIPYPPLANITGQPSMTVPLYWTADQLPIGSLFTAALGQDLLLLQLAKQLEDEQPWINHFPSI